MAPRGRKRETSEPLSNDVVKAEIDKKYREERSKGKITQKFLDDYPEPHEVKDQIINLEDLEDPPDDFEIPTLTSRNPTMPNSYALVRFHFWNINHGRLQNGETRLKAFTKLFWNQDEQHRVRNIDDLRDIKHRDAGPRLLKPDILRRLNIAPISRAYPNRPVDVEEWEKQRKFPTLRDAKLKDDSGGPNSAGGDQNSLLQEDTPPHLDLIRETLEKLLIRLAYWDLEVPGPTNDGGQAYNWFPVPSHTYNKYSKLQAFQMALDSNHNVLNASTGTNCYFRECGPPGASSDGSISRFDCILMVGKFLDAGFTRTDMAEFSSGALHKTSDHLMFESLIKSDWTFSQPQDIASLRTTMHEWFHNLEATDFTDLLNKGTLLRQQFRHTLTQSVTCEDNHEINRSESRRLLCLEDGYPSLHQEFSMQDILQTLCSYQTTAPESRTCSAEKCKKTITQRGIKRSLPLRLAISLPSNISPPNHTSDDIRVRTFINADKDEIVAYRWLGGIYSDTETEDENTHYRVYWTDAVRGKRPTRNIRMYDPRNPEGRVLEDIVPSQKGQIPDSWWKNKVKPVLFYERVLNPNSTDVTLAAAILGDMHHAIRENQLILQVHEPWKLIDGRGGGSEGSSRTPAGKSPGKSPGGVASSGNGLGSIQEFASGRTCRPREIPPTQHIHPNTTVSQQPNFLIQNMGPPYGQRSHLDTMQHPSRSVNQSEIQIQPNSFDYLLSGIAKGQELPVPLQSSYYGMSGPPYGAGMSNMVPNITHSLYSNQALYPQNYLQHLDVSGAMSGGNMQAPLQTMSNTPNQEQQQQLSTNIPIETGSFTTGNSRSLPSWFGDVWSGVDIADDTAFSLTSPPRNAPRVPYINRQSSKPLQESQSQSNISLPAQTAVDCSQQILATGGTTSLPGTSIFPSGTGNYPLMVQLKSNHAPTQQSTSSALSQASVGASTAQAGGMSHKRPMEPDPQLPNKRSRGNR